MERYHVISTRIQNLCREKKMSYYMLAFRSTVPITTIMNIIHENTGNPGIMTLFKICEGFGITPKEFFDDEIFSEMEED